MLRTILTIGMIQAIAISISLVRSKLLAVLLGPEGLGVTSVVDQVVQLAAYLSAFSLPVAAVKYLSRAHSEGAEAFRRTYSGLLQALLILSLCGAAIAIAIAFFRIELLGAELAKFRTYLLIALLAIPAMTLGGLVPNVLAAAQKANASSAVALVTNAGVTIASVTGILWGGFVVFISAMSRSRPYW